MNKLLLILTCLLSALAPSEGTVDAFYYIFLFFFLIIHISLFLRLSSDAEVFMCRTKYRIFQTYFASRRFYCPETNSTAYVWRLNKKK